MAVERKTKRVKIATEKNTTVLLKTAEVVATPPESDEEIDPAQFLEAFDSSSSASEDEDGGIPLDKLPAPPKPKAVPQDASKRSANTAGKDEPGVLFVGHIPHGFYEPQMRQYFAQFGSITPGHLRLSRNRRTGASKHYAFVQFDSGEVADIVQRTMDKYLIFGHILQVKRIPNDRVHPNMWIGAGKRFKKIPWNRLEGRALAAPRTREVWDRRIEREEERREKKKKVMEEYGYEFDIPELKKTKDVPLKSQRQAVEAEEAPKLLEAAAVESVDTLQDQAKKRKSLPEEKVVEAESSAPAKRKSKRKAKGTKN
jgi:nucleolar protein 15